MQVSVVLLLFSSLFSFILSETPPQLSETFTATIRVTTRDFGKDYIGMGVWGANQPTGMGIENIKYENGKYDVFDLQRYDLGELYMLSPENNSKCMEVKVNGTMPEIWAWVQYSKFIGKAGHGNESVDVWEARIGYAVMRIGVMTSNPNIPIYMVREAHDERKTSVEFLKWSTTAPPSSYFNVPSECTSQPTPKVPTAKDACIDSSSILARAKVWVEKKVPYNQGATYQGYREDCSGYVSMSWESSQPGHTTQTFYQIAHPISKGDLLPGDCLLYAAEHVVLFGGWTDSSQTYYMGYEETQPGTGTVAQNTPYPYWYSQSDFLPYRYNDFCGK